MYQKTIINGEEHRVALPGICRITTEYDGTNWVGTVTQGEPIDGAIVDISVRVLRSAGVIDYIFIYNVPYELYGEDGGISSSVDHITGLLMGDKIYIWRMRTNDQ